MKRFLALLAVGAVAAAALAVPSVAVDTKGPPCADIVGVTGNSSYALQDGVGVVNWTFELAAPACNVVTYRLMIFDNLEGTGLPTTVAPTSVSGTEVVFHHTFPGTAPSGVCLAGTTSLRPHVADHAPDSACLPVPLDSAGGTGFN